MPAEDLNFCTFYIVRHGETEWNVKHITQGHKDSPLTENGIRQAQETAEELRGINFDAIFSSDLGRTKSTAEILRLERQLAIQTSKALRERTFGSYEGRTGEDNRRTFQELYDEVKKLSEEEQKNFKPAPDVESDNEIISRFITQLREIAVACPGKTVLVVSHGGPIRNFLMHVGYVKYGERPGSAFANAGYVKVLCDGIDFFVKEVKGIKKD